MSQQKWKIVKVFNKNSIKIIYYKYNGNKEIILFCSNLILYFNKFRSINKLETK